MTELIRLSCAAILSMSTGFEIAQSADSHHNAEVMFHVTIQKTQDDGTKNNADHYFVSVSDKGSAITNESGIAECHTIKPHPITVELSRFGDGDFFKVKIQEKRSVRVDMEKKCGDSSAISIEHQIPNDRVIETPIHFSKNQDGDYVPVTINYESYTVKILPKKQKVPS